ncbi:hypothetical protein D3C76_679280 [compost metagenome]
MSLEPPQRPWLQIAREKRAMRTVNLGKRAIDLLLSESEVITFSNIAKKSRVVDSEGKGIHPNSIRSNTELYEYYKNNSGSYKKVSLAREKKRVSQEFIEKIDFTQIKKDRDLSRVCIRYKQMTKIQLIERLIQAEQYIVESHHSWLVEQFEKYTENSTGQGQNITNKML